MSKTSGNARAVREAPALRDAQAPAMRSVLSPDERLKKSAAYQHTTFFRIGLDHGKQYQKRICSYCTAVFSFKGGTTSAALRHLKTAHPERLQPSRASAGVGTKAAASADPPPALPQPHHSDTRTVQSSSDKTAASPRTAATLQPASDQAVVLASVATDAPQPAAVAELSSSSTAASPSTPRLLLTPVLQVPSSATDAAIGTAEASSAAVEALASEPIQQQQPHPQASSTRKRQRSDPDNDASLAPGSTSPTSSAPATAAAVAPVDSKAIADASLPPAVLTSSQTAITHFLQHYKELLAPPSRLRFVKHLTHHVSEAEMYNVLDEATQLEFIREFADPSTAT